MAAWLPLVFLPRVRWTATVVPVVMPLLLAVVYVVLVAATLPRSDGGFSSLAGVRALFDNPWVLLAGWTHYLAFDLFIGGWEVRDAQRRGIPHLLVVPALVLTFLLGPAGLLLYLAIRWFTRGAGGVDFGSRGHGRGVTSHASRGQSLLRPGLHLHPGLSIPFPRVPEDVAAAEQSSGCVIVPTPVIVLPEWMKRSCRPTPS